MGLDLSFGNDVSADVRPTETALVFLSEPSHDQWLALVRELAGIQSGARWWLGDALAYGQRRYGETYQEAADATGLSVSYLRNLASFSRKIPPANRIPHLSHGHHVAVMRLKPEEQRVWLGRAWSFGWSKSELLDQIRYATDAATKPEDGAPPKPPRGFEFVCPKCSYGWSGSPTPPGFGL